jgi:hypothetical protein
MHLTQGAAYDREILRSYADGPAVHQSVPGDDSLSGRFYLVHPKLFCAVSYESVDFDKRAGIKESGYTLASGHLSCLVLPLDSLSSATLKNGFPALLQTP